ncbi:hybrid sensor histidine kinase/response regulator [Roseibium sp. M-1]
MLKRSDTPDQLSFLIAQARQLKAGVLTSCLFVEIIIANSAVMLFFQDLKTEAAIWFGSASFMVLVTFAYNSQAAKSGIKSANVQAFLKGHIAVTCVTGLLWSANAIYLFDPASDFRVFISTLIVFSITLGGMLPGAVYRPAFVALAICCLLPFGTYVLATADWPYRAIGIGSFVYFAFGMVTSARSEENSREASSAETTKALMAEVVTQKDTIQKIHEEKTRFLAATSHDLSQPLHAQGYFLHLLRDKLQDPEALKLLERIENSWRGQVELLRGLVEINRLDSGSVVPDLTVFRCKPELEALAAEFDALTTAKSISLTTDIQNIQAITDPVLLTRIVRNLLSNAIKYTPAGGAVSLMVRHDTGIATIEVADNGPGIPKVKQEAIFEEYVQLQNRSPDTASGFGLGLSIVRRLAQLLDVGVSVHSEPGKGSVFRLTFKASPVTDTVLQKPAEVLEKFAHAPLVVLVDDQAAVLSGMGGLLTLWGCQVISATSSKEALHLLGETSANPSLLIVDKRLGDGESGLALIQALRDEVNDDTPALLMSGDLGGEENLALPAGVTFLKKPIEPARLRRILERTVQR